VSARNLAPSTSVALITANPGGDCVPTDHPAASCEHGCAYVIERWGTSAPGRHKLQVQVQALFEELALTAGFGVEGGLDLLNRSLLAYFIPFRSARLAELHRPVESRAFARSLWTELFRYVDPKVVITIDRRTHRDLRWILQQTKHTVVSASQELATGWGRYCATLDEYRTGTDKTMLLRLPHLSTFHLFTSVKCSESIRRIIGLAGQPLRHLS
jgi:hypothetical protein